MLDKQVSSITFKLETHIMVWYIRVSIMQINFNSFSSKLKSKPNSLTDAFKSKSMCVFKLCI